MQPRLREVFVGGRGVGEGLRGVVGGEEVFDYGAGFPEGEGGVWVGDGGDAAVGVEGFEGLWFFVFVVSLGTWRAIWLMHLGCGRLDDGRTFLEIAKVFDFGLVGDVELVEDDGYFPWVGALCLVVRLYNQLITEYERLISRLTPAWLYSLIGLVDMIELGFAAAVTA